MTARTATYGLLTSFPGLVALIGGEDNPRVFAKKAMTSSIEQHPYIVYQLGNETDEGLAEDSDQSRQFLQIFVHDFSDEKTGDYINIDAVLVQIKAAFKFWSAPDDGIQAAQYLETSQDLNDETLNTVMKYIRFQLIKKEIYP